MRSTAPEAGPKAPITVRRSSCTLRLVVSTTRVARARSGATFRAGSEAHPDVDVQFGEARWQARAEVLSAEERAGIWPKITAKFPNFSEYQQKTTRQIPVLLASRP
mgnify:CR=1 FL=1